MRNSPLFEGLQICCSSFLPFKELKKMEWVSFVLALSTRTRVFPPASVRWEEASKMAKTETKNPEARHVSFANTILEERKEECSLVFVFTALQFPVAQHTRGHARNRPRSICLGLIHQVEAGWTTLHTVDVVLEYRNLKYNKIIIKKLVFYFFTCGAK